MVQIMIHVRTNLSREDFHDAPVVELERQAEVAKAVAGGQHLTLEVQVGAASGGQASLQVRVASLGVS